jgi:predicted amidohydrolase
MKIRIAVVQFHTRLHDPETNMRRMVPFVRRARERKADVVIFPEEFLTGPVRSRLDLVDGGGKFLGFFRELAAKHRIDLIPGSVAEKVRGKTYNAAYYIDARGKVLSRYAKVNLWITERAHATPGRVVQAFRTKYGKVGLSICWDLAFPEIYRTYARQGAEIVFNASLWSLQDAGPGLALDPDAERKFIDSCCTARAFENEVVMVYSNVAGRWTLGGQAYESAGRSQISMPFRGPVRMLEHGREGMFVQDVDTSVLGLAEEAYQIRSDLRTRLRAGPRQTRRG